MALATKSYMMETPSIRYRAATPYDATVVAMLGERLHSELLYGDVAEYQADAVEELLQALQKQGTLLVALSGSEVVGFLGFMVSPIYFNRNARIAQELFWWCAENHRGTAFVGPRLLGMAETVAKQKGAAVFCSMLGQKAVDNGVGRYLERKGYKRSEVQYFKRLG